MQQSFFSGEEPHFKLTERPTDLLGFQSVRDLIYLSAIVTGQKTELNLSAIFPVIYIINLFFLALNWKRKENVTSWVGS